MKSVKYPKTPLKTYKTKITHTQTTMIETLNNCDLFSQKFSFNAEKGSKKYKTAVGGLLTLLGASLFSLVSLIVMTKLRETTDPVISVNTLKLKKSPILNVSEHQIGMPFFIAKGIWIIEKQDIPKYLTLKAELITRTITEENKIIEKSINLDVKECGAFHEDIHQNLIAYEKKHPGSLYMDNVPLLFEHGVCPDFKSPTVYLQGGKNSLTSTRLEMKFYPCSLPDRSQCASKKEIEDNGIHIYNFPLTKIANLSDLENPISNYIEFNTLKIDFHPKSKIRMTQHIKENLIYDDLHDFREPQLREKFLDMDRIDLTTGSRTSEATYCSKGQIQSGDCEPYLTFSGKSSGQRTEIRRYYKKFFGSISEVGGYTDIIIYSLWVLYVFYNQREYRKWIRSQLVDQFMSLEQKKGTLKRQRTNAEVALLKQWATGKYSHKDSKADSKALFDTSLSQQHLRDLNFKSEILLSLLAGPKFNYLYKELLLVKKGITSIINPGLFKQESNKKSITNHPEEEFLTNSKKINNRKIKEKEP